MKFFLVYKSCIVGTIIIGTEIKSGILTPGIEYLF
jgi:hypothetical protein